MQKNNIRWRTALGYDMGKELARQCFILFVTSCVYMEDLEVDTNWNAMAPRHHRQVAK